MASQRHADLAEADHHHMALEFGGAGVELGQGTCRRAFEAVEKAASDPRDQRRREHRQRDGDGQRVAQTVAEKTARHRDPHDDEGELAALAEQDTELQR